MNIEEHQRWAEHYKGVSRRLNPAPQKIQINEIVEPKYEIIKTPLQKIVDDVVKPALRGTGFTMEDIRGDRKFTALCRVRWKICESLKARGWSTLKIGTFINKDHTSVVNGLKQMKKERENKCQIKRET